MSNSDIMLDELLASQPALTLLDPDTEPHIIINSNRAIDVPAELRKIAVQYDHKIETVTFDCPRYWAGQDMSKMRVYINYMRADGAIGMSLPKNLIIDDFDKSVMHFDWTITRGATLYPGTLSFNVCIKKPNEQGNEDIHWNSEINKQMYVSPGLEYEEQKNPNSADLISDLIGRMEETELTVERSENIMNLSKMNSLLASFDNIKYELAKRTETVLFDSVIKASKWSTSGSPYTNTISVPGMLKTDRPHATPVYSDDNSVAIEQEEAWNMISEGEADNDAITFVCFEELPSVDIPIQIECFRTWINEGTDNPGSSPVTAYRLTDISLSAKSWKTSGNKSYQAVNIPGITPFSKVDLLPSPDQLNSLVNNGITLITANDNGVVTVYSVGSLPNSDYVFQASISEVV